MNFIILLSKVYFIKDNECFYIIFNCVGPSVGVGGCSGYYNITFIIFSSLSIKVRGSR